MFFSDEVSGLPPAREVEFMIDLVPGIAHISKVHIKWLYLSSGTSRFSYKIF